MCFIASNESHCPLAPRYRGWAFHASAANPPAKIVVQRPLEATVEAASSLARRHPKTQDQARCTLIYRRYMYFPVL